MCYFATRALSALALGTVLLVTSAQTAQAQFPIRPNPVIGDTGQQISGLKYNPFTGRWELRTDRTQVRESALDWNRNQMDPGSYRRVDEFETDRNGVRWHVTGYRWTTNGVPHGNLNRRRVSGSGIPGVDIDQNENIVFSPQTQSSGSRNRNINTRSSLQTSQNRNHPGSFNTPIRQTLNSLPGPSLNRQSSGGSTLRIRSGR